MEAGAGSLYLDAIDIDSLSPVRDYRKMVCRLKVRCMELTKEELIDALSLTRDCRKTANRWLKERKAPLSIPSPIFLWERGGRGCLSLFSALFNFCKFRLSETHTLTLSLVRERASISSSLARFMHRTFKLETIFRQSQTRKTVAVCVFSNLSLQNLNKTRQKDRHLLPPLSRRAKGEGIESGAFVPSASALLFVDSLLVRERGSRDD
jgi:hypothetical protein